MGAIRRRRRAAWLLVAPCLLYLALTMTGHINTLKSRGQTRVRAALLGGWQTLRLYGVELVDLFDRPPGEVPRTEYVALGASFLNGSTVPAAGPGSGRETNEARRNYFAAYRARVPEKVFAHAIYLYRVDALP